VNPSRSTSYSSHEEKRAPSPVYVNIVQLPQEEDVKYLGLHLDRRLAWRKHILAKRKQLGITLIKMHWLLDRKSKLHEQQTSHI
jgi:hypothetical protein